MLQKQLDRIANYEQLQPTSTTFIVDGITYSSKDSKVPSTNYKPIKQELATLFIKEVLEAKSALTEDEATQKAAIEKLQLAIRLLTDDFQVVGIQ